MLRADPLSAWQTCFLLSSQRGSLVAESEAEESTRHAMVLPALGKRGVFTGRLSPPERDDGQRGTLGHGRLARAFLNRLVLKSI